MDNPLISACRSLSVTQKAALKKGGILNVADLLLAPSNEVAKKCRISPLEVQAILDIVCQEQAKPNRLLEDIKDQGDQKFTTGDAELDRALGGGVRTGMIWEIVGESAAGKTQMALQLTLLVQIPPTLGGISGSACYLTTSSKLPTSRLVQISKAHPLLSPSLCSLTDIQTITTPTIPILTHVLSTTLPAFLKEQSNVPHSKPVKLLVIDALAELFHSSNKTTTKTLVERSRNISEISLLLHSLASDHQIAVLVLNEVTDAFEQAPGTDVGEPGDLIYREQSRWFGRADNIPGEKGKEASLGLVWANQVNVRILFSRTGRRRYLDQAERHPIKHRKFESHPTSLHTFPRPHSVSTVDDQSTLIRRLSIIFSSVSLPKSLDYIVTVAGISIIPEDISTPSGDIRPLPANQLPLSDHARAVTLAVPFDPPPSTAQVPPLDAGYAEDRRGFSGEGIEEPSVDASEDEWEAYWKDDDIPEEAYNIVLDPVGSTAVESNR